VDEGSGGCGFAEDVEVIVGTGKDSTCRGWLSGSLLERIFLVKVRRCRWVVALLHHWLSGELGRRLGRREIMVLCSLLSRARMKN
jgi:hypothetical protein